MERYALLVGLAALVALVGCVGGSGLLGTDADSEPARLAFEDVTDDVGLTYEADGTGVGNGNSGVYTADTDDDGWTDVLALGGDRPVLFSNEQGTFERSGSLPALDRRFKSAAFVDVEGDGWIDLLLFAHDGTVVSLRNDAGQFERTDYGLDDLTYPLGAAAADYDDDGDTDLFVYQSGAWSEHKPVGYLQPDGAITTDNGNPNILYENAGGTYERVTETTIEGAHWSLAASFTDLTGDGRPDIHVANDYNNDTLYLNRGGSFERRELAGSTARNGMASETADLTGDGRQDVFVTNIWFPDLQANMSEERYERIKRLLEHVIHSGRTKGNTLLVGQSNGTLRDRADELGVRHGGWGWAAAATDFDNDGDRDLVHTTQNVIRVDRDDPVYTHPMVFQRDGERFSRVSKDVNGMRETNGRGMASLDFDNDGAQELVVATYDSEFVVYDNAATDGRRSIQFRATTEGGATALGAVVTVTAGDAEWTVHQSSNTDFLSQDSRVEHLGVGDAKAVTVHVERPDGTEQRFEDVATNRRVRLTKSGLVGVRDFDGPRE